ncbi:MAG: HEAT repeat domain-containing protein [Planctomycetaceae bacterium]
MERLTVLLLMAALAGAAPDARAEVRRRAAALERGTARERFELALFCEAHGLVAEARGAHEAVLLLEPDHRASRRALGYLRDGDCWAPGDARLRELGARVASGRESERRRAVHFLGECARDPRAVAALTRRLLLDPSAAVRAGAFEAMRPAGAAGTRALVGALDSRSSAVRLRAIEALGRWGDAAALPALRLRYRLAGGTAQGAWIGQTRQQAYVRDFDVEVA